MPGVSIILTKSRREQTYELHDTIRVRSVYDDFMKIVREGTLTVEQKEEEDRGTRRMGAQCGAQCAPLCAYSDITSSGQALNVTESTVP
ncbi:hypothetical protein FGB62_2g128 [Gracilaria domingensis]|nr:hypothetical protein FGB62_2g128 [Gracilaria domingensis]